MLMWRINSITFRYRVWDSAATGSSTKAVCTALILSSRLPSAKAFKHWVTAEEMSCNLGKQGGSQRLGDKKFRAGRWKKVASDDTAEAVQVVYPPKPAPVEFREECDDVQSKNPKKQIPKIM